MPPRRERVSAAAIGAAGGVGTALWAPVVEFLPTTAKAIGGSVLALVSATAGVTAWWRHRRERREDRDDY